MTRSAKILDKDLKIFGIVLSCFISLIVYFFVQDTTYKLICYLCLLGLALCSFLRPKFITLIYIIFLEIGKILGYINTRLILLVVYYLLFFPYAMVFKIMRKDILKYKIESYKRSYWSKLSKENADSSKKLDRPF